MHEMGNTRQIGTKLGVWLHQGLKALQFTTKPGRKTKKVAEQQTPNLLLAKFNGNATTVDQPASVRCAPMSPPIRPMTAIHETMPSLPAGKLGEIVRLMERQHGACLDDFMSLTGWRRHTVRAALCRLRQRGFVITTSQRNGQTIYTVQ